MSIEEEHVGDFDTVDIMDVPIAADSVSESAEYVGVHGIATITLGYNLVTATNQACNDSKQQGHHDIIIDNNGS